MNRKPQFSKRGVRHATINGHRFHLRLTDPTEDNYLWIDGRSPPLVLDQVATEFVELMIDAMWEHQQGAGDESGKVRSQVVNRMYQKYGTPFVLGKDRVSRRRIRNDLDRIFGTLLAMTRDTCLVERGLEVRALRQEEWAAPARMDLAVTYRCNLDCGHCYSGGSREMEELATKDWLRIYETLWEIGIPQVVFTGGEPLLREDLVTLVGEADEFVTGLVTNGLRLEEMAEPLRDASLDYVQVTLESVDPAIHNRMVGAGDKDAFNRTVAGIKKALALGMEVVTNTTLTSENADGFQNLIRFGQTLGLTQMACNSLICSGRGRKAREADSLTLEALQVILRKAEIMARRQCGITLQWYTPTCYHDLNPVDLRFGPKSCSAATQNMTIQPDGTVLPCQSWPETVGRILQDPWTRIWHNPVCGKLRAHGFGKEKEECADCKELPLCGGGCPLDGEVES